LIGTGKRFSHQSTAFCRLEVLAILEAVYSSKCRMHCVHFNLEAPADLALD
jgi:hypothetical protein